MKETYSVRLSDEAHGKLKRMAKNNELPISTFLDLWIKQTKETTKIGK